jgi:hypothetical protein
MSDTPIKYIVKEKSLIGNEIFEPGAEVTLPEGTLPAENLEPTCDRGRAKFQEYLESNAARVATMRENFAAESGSNEVLAKLIGAAVASALADQKREQEDLAARLAEAERKLAESAKSASTTKAAKAKAEPAPTEGGGASDTTGAGGDAALA